MNPIASTGYSTDNLNVGPFSFNTFTKGTTGKVAPSPGDSNGFQQSLDMKINSLRATVSEPARLADTVTEGVKDFVLSVDAKGKEAQAMRAAVLSGESNNLHQTMIASQEASVSFTLMLEMRNKVMEAYQELMRLQL